MVLVHTFIVATDYMLNFFSRPKKYEGFSSRPFLIFSPEVIFLWFAHFVMFCHNCN